MTSFFNELSTPSGKVYRLREITNAEYLTLLKFSMSENSKMVLQSMEEVIRETIDDYDNLNIIDKAYILMAFIFYNIRPVVSLKTPLMGDIEVSLTTMLDAIEKSYVKNLTIECEVNENMSIICSYPTRYEMDDNEISIDYLSGIREVKVNGKIFELSPDEIKTLAEKMNSKDSFALDELIRENISQISNLSENIPNTDLTINVVSPQPFLVILQMLKEPLETFYQQMYIMVQYVKFSREDYMSMSPTEVQVIIGNFLEDKRKQKEEMEQRQNSIT